ncbi:hypothetical protein HOV17_gp28 [Halorubrum pleomorphic virus 9]|uniref:Uncharacterized protein n=1 Tax=Halorubrum pleomorphic virus 9 TaxID=2126525 RepID=A0A3S7I9I2_9VIRU|nr:hypothetical protein HOV17_gp28 [Halorubrum pleomorphic virus 9]AVP39992.1 hypothetical protein [Halorubrum pleomorphic virus 9]
MRTASVRRRAASGAKRRRGRVTADPVPGRTAGSRERTGSSRQPSVPRLARVAGRTGLRVRRVDVFSGRASLADPDPRVALGTAVRAVVLVAVDATKVRGYVGVATKAVAPATVRSEQHHADTTSANADRGTVVTTGLILARTKHANGASRELERRNWVAGESQPTNSFGRSPNSIKVGQHG